AYGPYTHLWIARQAAQTLGLDAGQARAYAAGALLADLDKAGRLSKAFHGNAALVRAFQGCSQDGPVLRAQTHDPEGALVKALLQSPDRLVRAFALGIRSHAVTDRYADATAAQRLGHASSGEED